MERKLTLKQIKAEAARLGFDACGAAPAGSLPRWRVEQWRSWLSAGRHATMDYLARHADLRSDPRLLVEGARTVVSLAVNYRPSEEFPAGAFRLARYALGRDYHEVVKERLLQLMAALGLVPGVDGRAFCDTAPVDEHYWAWRCGLGFLGRHTQLIVPGVGTYCFLGELVLTVPVEGWLEQPPGQTAADVLSPVCRHCRCCIGACPAGALSEEAGLDARRCLSYLTIEHRGPLPPATGLLMGRCLYGCDRCAEVCPYNAVAKPAAWPEFRPRPELLAMQAADWPRLTVEQYRTLFKGSAVKRAKYEGLMRNVGALVEAGAVPADDTSSAEKGKEPES